MQAELVINNVKVMLSDDTGEGIFGEYDPDDPNDKPLMRFDVYKFSSEYLEWEAIDDASYCTNIDADSHWHDVMSFLTTLMDEVYEPVRDGYSIKKVCEKLSWLG
jgi:hypothetical protein